ncbi:MULTISPECIES: hypothetical protein [Corynebacterium]|uniref:Uncharacterized protein n=1 Tax=Corynebacterium pyruviciproducens TaxID=598660 RepID=A0AAF0YUE2_9CORY|nr:MULTISPECIES: hypothetical protein [Corynebacterium]MDU3077560.1 hypothetical protein [Mixta calida]MCT1443269.1 hypothetical protein [Corynebacterium glucuronolyticum]MDK7214357.1 hypothetical protein [Corynebacterium pyruviciproducens]QQU88474.1 hypothetical protein I6I68_00230 [Corynebacterium glucuronolyticum]WOT02094.1 hypothetical protein CYJ47_12740 [Corynebacterium pyruviciproducens]
MTDWIGFDARKYYPEAYVKLSETLNKNLWSSPSMLAAQNAVLESFNTVNNANLLPGLKVISPFQEQLAARNWLPNTLELVRKSQPDADLLSSSLAQHFMLRNSPAWEKLQKSISRNLSPSKALGTDVLKQYNRIFSDAALGVAEAIHNLQLEKLPDNFLDLHIGLSVKKIRWILSQDPYPIYNAPRAEIVEALILAETDEQRRAILESKASLIISDCREVLSKVSDPRFSTLLAHIDQGIAAYNFGLIRPAQAALAVVLDCMVARCINLTIVRTQMKNPESGKKELEKMALADFLVWAPIPASHVGFKGGKGEPPPCRFSRHGTIHSTGERQYSKTNFIYALMLDTSLLSWLSERADQYDF